MNKKRDLTQKGFDTLLAWLDPDRERAAQKYQTLHNGLIQLFTLRGCSGAEDLADETINRVALKVNTLAVTYVGDPTRYFYGVARKIYLESHREKSSQLEPENVLTYVPQEDVEPEYDCLEQCLDKLSADNKQFILRYYRDEKQAKIDARKVVGRELNLSPIALRVRAHRIRKTLEACIKECLAQRGECNESGSHT
jgi:DNA-directed RNA polymerase specialized sigma24 family protein